MKQTSFFLLFVCLFNTTFAQQFSLYNSRTLFDAFENPSQKAFQVDSSRKYAFNFFIPTIGVNGAYSGPAQSAFKSAIFEGTVDGKDLMLGENKKNTLISNSNAYIAMFRVFTKVNHNQEMGFSWQIRNDSRVNITHETLALIDDYKLFENAQYKYLFDKGSLFNNSGYNQSYHQVSFTFREDYDKRLSFGIKLSALNGITYNNLEMENSSVNSDPNRNDSVFLSLKGKFRSSYQYKDLGKDLLYPKFKNPGFSLGVSTSYKLKNSWFLMGNIKDVGFIKWNKKSYNYSFNKVLKITSKLGSGIEDMIDETGSQSGFTTLTNGKAEILINKDYYRYKPNLIISKNIFDQGGDVALIHNYRVNNFVFTASTDYNLNHYLQFGGQVMLKTPNVELFIGSDQLLQTYDMAKSILNSSADGKGYTGGSFYMGFAYKFGPAMENQQNANTISGFEDTNSNFLGIFRHLFSRK